jgi:predicted enzyme related to lactoylglutathione lyase
MRTINALRSIIIVITLGLAVAGQSATADEREGMAKVTGIGGVFFLSRGEGKELSAWYEKHLGMRLGDFGGANLKWEDDTAEDKGATVWKVADHDSDWFSPSKSSFMVNYRVDNMARMIEQLNAGGIDIHKGPEYHENGVFAWIMDPEGNKIELWEPMIWDEKNKK